MAELVFPNHLIVFPKWTRQALIMNDDMQIVGRRAADGYLTQLLMESTNDGQLPDFCVRNLDAKSSEWVEYQVDEKVIINVGKDKICYDPTFIDGEVKSLTLRLLMSFLRCYSSVDIN